MIKSGVDSVILWMTMGVCGGAGIPDHDSAFAEIAERWCSTRSWIHPIQAKKKKQAQSWKRAGTASDAEFGASSWMAMDGASCCAMHGRLVPSGVDGWAKISPDPASPDLITHGEYGNHHLGKSGDPTLNQRRVNFKVANVKVQMPQHSYMPATLDGSSSQLFSFTSIMRSYDIFFCFDFRYSETAGCDDVGQIERYACTGDEVGKKTKTKRKPINLHPRLFETCRCLYIIIEFLFLYNEVASTVE